MLARRSGWLQWTRMIAALLAAALLTGCGDADDPSSEAPGSVESPDDSGGNGEVRLTPASENDPHLPESPGPWFEGWYTRVTDAGGSRSVAVIAASHLPKGVTYVPGMDLPGYVNVLIGEGDLADVEFPIEERVFHNAVLEFGNEFVCP